jgi:hypothetical protein
MVTPVLQSPGSEPSSTLRLTLASHLHRTCCSASFIGCMVVKRLPHQRLPQTIKSQIQNCVVKVYREEKRNLLLL